jgi:hypothetical protein
MESNGLQRAVSSDDINKERRFHDENIIVHCGMADLHLFGCFRRLWSPNSEKANGK